EFRDAARTHDADVAHVSGLVHRKPNHSESAHATRDRPDRECFVPVHLGHEARVVATEPGVAAHRGAGARTFAAGRRDGTRSAGAVPTGGARGRLATRTHAWWTADAAGVH